MATDNISPKVKLDWSKLLGFDQIAVIDGSPETTQLVAPTLSKLGGKPSTIHGFGKIGGKVGTKPSAVRS